MNLFLKKSPVVTIVATGVGAALFFVVGKFAMIPSPVPNTSINVQYGILALFALIYGPIAGALIGFIGHFLIDASTYGPWWTWIVASGIFGFLVGLLNIKTKVDKDNFKGKAIVWFIISIVIANLVCFMFFAPVADVVFYQEPANKVFVQGVLAAISNAITASIIGTIIAVAYAKTKSGTGSLTEHVDD